MKQAINNVKNKRFIKYKLTGIKGINIKNSDYINLQNEGIEFVDVSESLDTITLYLKEDINKHDAWISCEDFMFKYIIGLKASSK